MFLTDLITANVTYNMKMSKSEDIRSLWCAPLFYLKYFMVIPPLVTHQISISRTTFILLT